MGRGALYPVKIFQHDRTTPVEGEFFSLSFGNQKTALVKGQSPKLRDANLGDNSWLLPFVLKDGDLTVTPQALDGPDLWIDTGVRRAIFGSDRRNRGRILGWPVFQAGWRRQRMRSASGATAGALGTPILAPR